MADGKGLALIFGKPDARGAPPTRDGDGEERDDEIPVEFEDACEAAFDAFRAKDSRAFTRALWDAIKATEERPHEEGNEPPEEE